MIPREPPKNKRLGQALVEFTLVGIPLIFILISTFEVSRGMWIYHTLAYSVRDGVRYASVHGWNCTQNGNTCNTLANVGNVASVIQFAGIGLDPAKTTLTFYTGPTDAAGDGKLQIAKCTLTACQGNATAFPPSGANFVGQPISISITSPFNSVIAMLWPGAKPVSFASGLLGATSTDTIKF
jgi:hypothetical protein